jgi:hypothetical protein
MPIQKLSDLLGRQLLLSTNAVFSKIIVADAMREDCETLREIALNREIINLIGGSEFQIEFSDLVVVLVRVLVLLQQLICNFEQDQIFPKSGDHVLAAALAQIREDVFLKLYELVSFGSQVHDHIALVATDFVAELDEQRGLSGSLAAYRDEVKHYRNEGDIADHIADLVLEVTDHLQQDAPPPIETGSLLQSLRIGDPTAENEMATLSEYYLQTDQYQRALQGSINVAYVQRCICAGWAENEQWLSLAVRKACDEHRTDIMYRRVGFCRLLKCDEDARR